MCLGFAVVGYAVATSIWGFEYLLLSTVEFRLDGSMV